MFKNFAEIWGKRARTALAPQLLAFLILHRMLGGLSSQRQIDWCCLFVQPVRQIRHGFVTQI